MFVKRLPGPVVLLLALAASPALGEEPAAEFYRYRIALHDEFGAVYPFDLTGNGLEDLVVVEIDRLERRVLMFASVFFQDDEGFHRAPAITPLPSSLSLAGMGNFVGGPGLAVLIPGRVEIWPWRDGKFVAAGAPGLAVESIFPVEAGEVRTEVAWIVDLNGDGRHEIVVPAFDGITVIMQDDGGRLVSLGWLPVRPHTRFWKSLTYQAVVHDVPSLYYEDVDGNGWRDVIAFSDGQLYIYPMDSVPTTGEREPYLTQDFQPPQPFDPADPWEPSLRAVKVEDINGDGLLDFVVAQNAPTGSSFTSTSNTLIYYGRGGEGGRLKGFPETPDQVFPSEGFTLPLLLDINGDALIDLVQVNVEVTFWNALRAMIARTVTAEAAFYLMGADGRYPAEPEELEDYSVKFSLNRFGHQPIATWGDINGDGFPDLLLSVDKEELGIHWGTGETAWDNDYDELVREFLPIHQRRLLVRDLNKDGRQDIVLTYIRADNRQMPETFLTLHVLLSNFPRPASETATR